METSSSTAPPSDLTCYLERLESGDVEALDHLVPALYAELRRVAHQRLRGERIGHTLGTTALVHETYLRLLGQKRIRAGHRQSFLEIAAATMRRVLIDYARARQRLKRGGGDSALPLSEVGEPAAPLLGECESEELLALDQALERLAGDDPRAGRVVELRFFGGLTLDETAELLAVSKKTVQRDWEAALAWLRKEVAGSLVQPAA